jgi:hypothetical protein
MNRKQWAKEFFVVVDSRQPEKITTYMTDDVRLQLFKYASLLRGSARQSRMASRRFRHELS